MRFCGRGLTGQEPAQARFTCRNPQQVQLDAEVPPFAEGRCGVLPHSAHNCRLRLADAGPSAGRRHLPGAGPRDLQGPHSPPASTDRPPGLPLCGGPYAPAGPPASHAALARQRWVRPPIRSAVGVLTTSACACRRYHILLVWLKLSPQKGHELAHAEKLALRVLVSSGEPLSEQLLWQLQDTLPEQVCILNIYGCTEVSADATCCCFPGSLGGTSGMSLTF